MVSTDLLRRLPSIPYTRKKLVTLEEAVRKIVEIHGGVRAAARFTGVDKAFISRLLRGLKTAPSADTLGKLGLEAVPLYRVLKPHPPHGGDDTEGE